MKSTFKAMLLVFVSILTLTVNTATLNAQSVTGTTNCADYQLSVDKDNIYSNKDELKVTLHYDSKDPLCSAEQLAQEQITIDLSNLVKDGSEIKGSYDTEVFNVNISDAGVVTITYKEWDTIHNTLENFSGDAIFTVTVDVDESGDKVITSNVGDDLVVNVQLDDEIYDNTNKWANVNYAETGDIINYKLRINTDRNEVTNFVGVDTPPAGLDYVDGSFTVKDYSTGQTIDPNIFTLEQGEDGSLTFKNTEPFSKTYIISYDMIVTGQYETYQNHFSATYDGTVEKDVYTVKYDVLGGGDVSFTNGQIDVLKTDTKGTPLPGAKFDIVNSDGNVVDHITTDNTGHAVSDKLALGDYQVIETEAPAGYVLDATPHDVSIIKDEANNNVVSLTIQNQAAEQKTGQIQITKTNEKCQALAGAEFDIIDSKGNVVDHVVTDKSGKATTIELPLGDYQVVETKAPNGYELDKTPHKVSITKDGQVVKLTVVNKKDDDNCNHGHDHDCDGNHGHDHDCNGNHGHDHDCNGNHGNNNGNHGNNCNGNHGNNNGNHGNNCNGNHGNNNGNHGNNCNGNHGNNNGNHGNNCNGNHGNNNGNHGHDCNK